MYFFHRRGHSISRQIPILSNGENNLFTYTLECIGDPVAYTLVKSEQLGHLSHKEVRTRKSSTLMAKNRDEEEKATIENKSTILYNVSYQL